jgi:hypothetical protein
MSGPDGTVRPQSFALATVLMGRCMKERLIACHSLFRLIILTKRQLLNLRLLVIIPVCLSSFRMTDRRRCFDEWGYLSWQYVQSCSEVGWNWQTVLQDKWSAVYSVHTILVSIQSLLGDPNNASPLNIEAAELWGDVEGELPASLMRSKLMSSI